MGITPSIGVVVPTYARRSLLTPVLTPLLADPAAAQVVVVVDGCDDGSMELLESMTRDHPALRPVWRENGGEGPARQTGLQNLSTDIVLFVDDDVVASPGLVSGHLQRQLGLSHTVVLGYMPVVQTGRRRPGQAPTYLYADEYERACRRFEAEPWRVLSRFWAGNFSMPTSDALAVQMASEGFEGLYHADQDFGLRCAVAGMSGLFDRTLVATHLHRRTLSQFAKDARAQGAARILLEARYSGRFVEATAEYLFADVPKPLQFVVKTGSGLSALRTVAGVGCGVAGALHAWPMESNAAKALRRCEQIRGASSAKRKVLAAARAHVTSAPSGA